MDNVRRHFHVCVVGSCIYLIGGYGRFRVRLTSLSCFDTKTYEWNHWQESVCGSPSKRDVVVIKNCIYVVDYAGTDAVIWCYDTTGKSWKHTHTEPMLVASKAYNCNDHLLFVQDPDEIRLYDCVTRRIAGLLRTDALDMHENEMSLFCDDKLYEPQVCPENDEPGLQNSVRSECCAMYVTDISSCETTKYHFENGNFIIQRSFNVMYYDNGG